MYNVRSGVIININHIYVKYLSKYKMIFEMTEHKIFILSYWK